MADEIRNLCQMFGYCQIEPREEMINWAAGDESKLSNVYKPLVNYNFKIVEVNSKDDIWPSFKQLLGKRVQVKS